MIHINFAKFELISCMKQIRLSYPISNITESPDHWDTDKSHFWNNIQTEPIGTMYTKLHPPDFGKAIWPSSRSSI